MEHRFVRWSGTGGRGFQLSWREWHGWKPRDLRESDISVPGVWFCQNRSRGWLERWELHKGDTRRIGRSQILKVPKWFQHYSERYKINLWISAARVIGTDVYWRVAEYAIPKMPLWHKDYFVLKAIEKKQIPEELSTFLLFISKTSSILALWLQIIKC